ncbi:MAG: cupin domain-containing protein [Armatimonadota bacterium]|nr:cupin domain-containing protein [Armatimonadota bacterium]
MRRGRTTRGAKRPEEVGPTPLELIRPEREGSTKLSLAQATVEPGASTHRHIHRQAEEVYYVLSGEGAVEVGGAVERVGPGDARLIPPGVEHRVTAIGAEPLVILCACSPPYRHEDTELTEPVRV